MSMFTLQGMQDKFEVEDSLKWKRKCRKEEPGFNVRMMMMKSFLRPSVLN